MFEKLGDYFLLHVLLAHEIMTRLHEAHADDVALTIMVCYILFQLYRKRSGVYLLVAHTLDSYTTLKQRAYAYVRSK